MFVATVLRRFRLDLLPASDGGKPKFPELDETTPTGGILSPMAGDDVFIRVQSRAT